MGKGGGGSTTTTTVDPASQNFINRQREQAEQAARVATGGGPFFTGPLTQTPAEMAEAFFNPFQEQVVGGVRGEFDFLRDQASTRAAQDATAQGAFGGSRAAISEGARLGSLDRAQTSQIAELLRGGFDTAQSRGTQFAEHQRQLRQQQMQEPLFRQQQALNFMNMGMGPTGQVQTTQPDRGSRTGRALGGAASGALAGSAFGPIGAGVGGGIGLLGGLFG